MKKLLTIEFIKLKSNSVFWVILGLFTVLYILGLTVFGRIDFEIQAADFDFKDYFRFPVIWNTATWLASWYNLLWAVLIIILIGNEYSYRTFRQQQINGLSRNQLIVSKIYIALLLAIFSVLLVMVSALVTGFVFSEVSGIAIFDQIYYLGVYFIQAVAYMILALFLAILVKNTALGIILFILYFFPIEPIIRSFFPKEIVYYFPMKVISNLTPMPGFLGDTPDLSNMADISISAPSSEPSLLITLAVALIYVLIFGGGAFYLINKRDL